jgi:Fic family protein
MVWNWQQKEWPNFHYHPSMVVAKDREFLQKAGGVTAILQHIGEGEEQQFIVELLSREGVESARIEGEILRQESLQSSIRAHFGLQSVDKKASFKERGMAAMLCSLYESYAEPLTHEMLYAWHGLLMQQRDDMDALGCYRFHDDPMQIVSNKYGNRTVYFEAPPSKRVEAEMTTYIEWFNDTSNETSLLGKASKAHLYFESIHPFEDGNGRIGRALVEKFLSSSLGHPTLIAISTVVESDKKEYYKSLASCNRSLNCNNWVLYFSNVVLQAQKDSPEHVHFLLNKARLMGALAGDINERQEKALLRMLAEGSDGFAGGLSADKYISITKAARATATRDLADLVEKGALVKSGQLRTTRYWLPFETGS